MNLAHSINGRCIVCSIEGRGHRDFICEYCGDPGGITVVCGCCRTRRPATPEAIDALRHFTGIDIPKTTGVVIKTSCCVNCYEPGDYITTAVYTLRVGYLN